VSLFPSTITSSSSLIFVDREIQTSPLIVTLPPIIISSQDRLEPRPQSARNRFIRIGLPEEDKYRKMKYELLQRLGLWKTYRAVGIFPLTTSLE
tara:strand:- start:178 stop:459 length:282 start_codon:yes stop_codon:yes gene_type:complete